MQSSLATTKSNSSLFFAFFLLSVIAMYFAFAPVIHIPFYHHDIYKFAYGGWSKSCAQETEAIYQLSIDMVRPVTAYLDCLNFRLANNLHNMAHLRVVCVVLSSIVMAMLAAFLYSATLPFWVAFLITGAIFFLPALQTVMIMGATFLVASLWLALLSQFFITKSHSALLRRSYFSIPYFLIGIAALIGSLFTYNSMTAAFFLPTLALVLFKPLSAWSSTRICVIRDTLVYGLCSVIYLIYAKYFTPKHVIYADIFQITFSTFKLNGLYLSMSSLWNLDAGFAQRALIDFIILLGCLTGIANHQRTTKINNNKNPATSNLVQVVLATLGLFILGSSVYLLAPMSGQVEGIPVGAPFGRVILVSQAMSILFLFWSLFTIVKFFRFAERKLLTTAALGLFFLGAFYANYNVTLSALNDYTEINYVSTVISQQLASGAPIKRIHLIGPAVNNFTGQVQHEDIFNGSSTRYSDDSAHIIKTVLIELRKSKIMPIFNCGGSAVAPYHGEANCIKAAPPGDIIITYSHAGERYRSLPDSLIIDMGITPVMKI